MRRLKSALPALIPFLVLTAFLELSGARELGAILPDSRSQRRL